MPSIGEQAVNKMVEMAISSQIDDVDKLDIQVKTDPSKLAHGEVGSIAISGAGWLVQEDLRLEQFRMQLDEIAVKPLSAMFGKIELSQPTGGTVCVVLTETDLSHALNLSSINKQLSIDNSLNLIEVQYINCQLHDDHEISVHMTVKTFRQDGSNHNDEITVEQHICFIVMPLISANGENIVLEKIEHITSSELSSQLAAIVIEKLDEILNLSTLEMEGVCLQIRQFKIAANKITLQANVQVAKIPSAK